MGIVITGGAGFIGSHLAEALAERGVKVRIFDKCDLDPALKEKLGPNVEIVRGDFVNEADISKALEGMETVVHLACTTLPASSNENPIHDIETNLTATVRMLELALQAGVQRVIYASSGGTVYGPAQTVPIPENHPTEPICSHAINKLAVEKYLALFGRLRGLEWTAIRASNPYGKRQRPGTGQGAVTVFADAIKRGEVITIWGDGNVVRDYIHVSDLVSAYVRVIENMTSSNVYNIGCGKGVSLNKLIKLLAKVSGIDPKIEYASSRKVDVPENVLDCSRAKADLGWEPKIELEEGLKEYFEED